MKRSKVEVSRLYAEGRIDDEIAELILNERASHLAEQEELITTLERMADWIIYVCQKYPKAAADAESHAETKSLLRKIQKESKGENNESARRL